VTLQLASRSPSPEARARISSLLCAAILIRDLEPFRQARPVWDRTAEMILIAATTKKQADVREATRQSERA